MKNGDVNNYSASGRCCSPDRLENEQNSDGIDWIISSADKNPLASELYKIIINAPKKQRNVSRRRCVTPYSTARKRLRFDERNKQVTKVDVKIENEPNMSSFETPMTIINSMQDGFTNMNLKDRSTLLGEKSKRILRF